VGPATPSIADGSCFAAGSYLCSGSLGFAVGARGAVVAAGFAVIYIGVVSDGGRDGTL
jgi:hypothetical protein